MACAIGAHYPILSLLKFYHIIYKLGIIKLLYLCYTLRYYPRDNLQKLSFSIAERCDKLLIKRR